jgi:hypothetical protein
LKTNTQSATAYRGFGGPQGIVGIERVIDHLAHHLRLDPVTLMQRNAVHAMPGPLAEIVRLRGRTATVPVVLLAHGGTFIFGNKQDMKDWCERYARKGYVAASIQYRLYPVIPFGFPDSVKIIDAAVKAMSDMKAAVRFLNQDAAGANQFKIDPEHIFIGGYSAGGVAALHAAYLDTTDAMDPFIRTTLDNNGGLNGNSGDATNLSFPFTPSAVVNMSGGLYRRAWITENSVPLVSFHGTADATVAYESGLAANLIYLEGSGILHPQAELVGLMDN